MKTNSVGWREAAVCGRDEERCKTRAVPNSATTFSHVASRSEVRSFCISFIDNESRTRTSVWNARSQ